MIYQDLKPCPKCKQSVLDPLDGGVCPSCAKNISKSQGIQVFAGIIRRGRENKKAGLRAAARDIGVSPTTFTRLERGEDCFVSSYLKALDWAGHGIEVTERGGLKISQEFRPPTKAEIFKAHAAIWREQAREYGECVGWERNEADKEFWGAMGHFCERMAERYEKAAEETE